MCTYCLTIFMCYIIGYVLSIILIFLNNRVKRGSFAVFIGFNEALIMSLFSWISVIYFIGCIICALFSKINNTWFDKWFKGTNIYE